nr:MAG TPA: hypothetical protein [Caudoviricetes sp.]
MQQVHNISAARGGAWLRLFVKDLTARHATGLVEGGGISSLSVNTRYTCEMNMSTSFLLRSKTFFMGLVGWSVNGR